MALFGDIPWGLHVRFTLGQEDLNMFEGSVEMAPCGYRHKMSLNDDIRK